jgi:hypothetical protein
MSVHIQPARLDGEFWVEVSMDGEMSRHGPFSNAGRGRSHGGPVRRDLSRSACGSGHGRTEVEEIPPWVKS